MMTGKMNGEVGTLNWGDNWDEMRSVNEANLNKLVDELAEKRTERMKILAEMKLPPVRSGMMDETFAAFERHIERTKSEPKG
jgi:NifU-like protein involved in Fe-S cluster formation